MQISANQTNKLIQKLYEINYGDPKRIQHFIKVHSIAKTIGELEHLDETTQAILETAAIVHDIGIHHCEQVYGNCNGKLQEQEGPNIAQKVLTELGYEKEIIERVCYLVGHHHTYHDIQGLDYQILVEADFLVNLYEEEEKKEVIETVLHKIIRTETGKELLRTMYGL